MLKSRCQLGWFSVWRCWGRTWFQVHSAFGRIQFLEAAWLKFLFSYRILVKDCLLSAPRGYRQSATWPPQTVHNMIIDLLPGQHKCVFLPSKYWPGSTLLSWQDQTGLVAFRVVRLYTGVCLSNVFPATNWRQFSTFKGLMWFGHV